MSEANLTAYLATHGVVACGGSWLADRSLVAAADFDTIAERARRAVGIVDQQRLDT